MKLVVVDVGNTSTAVGLWSGGRVTRVRHIDGMDQSTEFCAPAYHAGDRPAAFAAAEALASRAEAIAYVSVVPKADAAWRRFAKQHGLPFVRIDHALFLAASGLALDYPKPEWIMLDNMSCADMKKCVKMCKGISKTEASGGITLDRAREVAATGVTAISLGCLTHSAGSVDLSLEWKAV